MKDPGFIDSFRGIYMPYWSYLVIQKGEVSLSGEKSKRSGDYVYTDHYALEAELDAEYEGYSCDASSGFYDNISEALAPYDIRAGKEFTPAFLSGFYADMADVDPELYREDAEGLANSVTYGMVSQEPVFKKHGIKKPKAGQMSRKLNTHCDSVTRTMFPVWFMSYRNGDRIAYAAVNGQTGKVAADLPVDRKKFFACSLLLAVPLFIFLNLFLTLRPAVLLGISAVLAVAAAFVYDKELAAIFRREINGEDRALHKSKDVVKKKPSKRLNLISILTLIIVIAPCLVMLGAVMNERARLSVLWLAAIAAMGWICIAGIRKYNRMRKDRLEKVKGGQGFLISTVTVLVGGMIWLWNPVSDLWYYGAALLILLTVIFILGDLIGNYNRLAMRRLPQFDKKGGDDNA